MENQGREWEVGLNTEKTGDIENRWGVKAEGNLGKLTIATVTQDMDNGQE